MTVLEFPTNEPKTKYTTSEHGIGLITSDKKLELVSLNKQDIMVVTESGSHVHDRAELAEFLWMAAILLDGDRKWIPNGELVSHNY